jgi:hypothetical protein
MKGLAPLRWQRVWAVTRWVAVAAALPLVWACNSRTLGEPTPNPVRVVNNTFQATLNRKMDILFMVDNSSSMLPLQAKLLAQFPVFMNVLKMLPTGDGAGVGLPDVHVAVVSSDTGPGKYDLSDRHCAFGGDHGQFQAIPRGNCTTAPLANGQTYLAASMNQGVKNYTGDISDAFTCIAALGDQGCGFEGQLKSVRWALDPLNVPAGNDGFLRSDAFLAVILITNEDDCSVPDDSDLVDPSQTTMSSLYGPLWSYRCNEFGHLCQIGGTLTPPPRGPATDLQGCVSNETASGKLTHVGDEVAFLKSLKNDPNQIFVAAITGPATPYGVEMIQQGADTEMHPNVIHSCTQGTGEYADPSVRIQQWVEAFGDHGLAQTICAPSFAPSLSSIATELSKLLGPQCIGNNLVDSDADPANGLQPKCQVNNRYIDNTGKTVETPVQSCVVTNNIAPCWSMDVDATKCPGNFLILNVKFDGTPPDGLNTAVSCATCIAGIAQPGCP